MASIADLLRESASKLPSETARIDVEWLLGFLLQKNSAWLFAHGSDEFPEALQAPFRRLLERRLQGEPVAHIIGSRGFWKQDLIVTADTLIPRPETELLVECALSKYSRDKACHVLDLGTGSGAIALALAGEFKNVRVLAVDKSAAALEVARANARRNHLAVEFVESDWFSAIENEKFDLIVSNPPYIPQNDPHLSQGDVRFEPRSALASGADGLEDIRRIVSQAATYCRPDAWLMIEHGYDQGEAIRALFSDAGFAGVETAKDLEQRDRVTLGQWK